MSVADKFGLGPTRKAQVNEDGGWTVFVTPPSWVQDSPKTAEIKLTQDQYKRYLLWLNTDVLIQRALPDVSIEDRELLMHGLDLQDIGPEPTW